MLFIKYLYELAFWNPLYGHFKNKQIYEKSAFFPILFAFFRSPLLRGQTTKAGWWPALYFNPVKITRLYLIIENITDKKAEQYSPGIL